MEGDDFELAAMLREERRPSDDVFVDDVDWLIAFDIDHLARRREALRRWCIDLLSATAVGAVGYVVADTAPGMAFDTLSALSIPMLVAAFVPALWLFTRSQSRAA